MADTSNSLEQARPIVFYLHGKIVEDQGARGVSERYGQYDYPGILTAFRERGFQVISEHRPAGTDVSVYADKMVAQIRRLLAAGHEPDQITVIGASKGSVIAALVSSRLKMAKVRYVLLANCNDWLVRTYDPHLTGDVLSIYEESDEIGGSCAPVFLRSPAPGRREEIRLHTNLGHGMVYRPLPEWVDPAASWARNNP